MCGLFSLLARIVEDCDDDGPEVHFTTTGSSMKNRDTHELYNLAQNTQAHGYSNLEAILDRFIERHENKLRLAKANGNIKAVIPLSIYIFTDGLWSEGNPEVIFLRLQNLLDEYGLSRIEVGIQFISFGRSQEGIRRMKNLDDMVEGFGLPQYVNSASVHP